MSYPAVPRRIDLIGPGSGTRGGIAQFNTELTRLLRESGAEACILDYRRTYPSFSRAGRQGSDPSVRREEVPTTELLVPWLPWTWVRAAATVLRHAPQVLVVQWWHPITALASWYLSRRARRYGTKVIFICHNAWPHEGFPFARSLTRLALRHADSLITLSDGVAEELRLLLPHAAISVIPHPPYTVLASETDAPALDAWRRRIAAPTNAKIVLCFGNVRPYKGVRDLVEAFPRVATTTNAILVVAGTFFEPVDSYRARIQELGLGDSVRLFDEYIPNEDVAALFTLSDLVVLPYRSASQSGVIPLAAIFRKPVVTTNVGGLPAALAGSGLVVPPNDPEALAAAVIEALETPPEPPPSGQDLWDRWRDAVLSS